MDFFKQQNMMNIQKQEAFILDETRKDKQIINNRKKEKRNKVILLFIVLIILGSILF